MGRNSWVFILAATVGLVLGPISAGAQSPADVPGTPPAVLLQRMQTYREAYIAQLLSPFRSQSGPDQLLTVEDVKRMRDKGFASVRSGLLGNFFNRDLDGNDKVTSDEMNDGLAIGKTNDSQTGMDTNADGTITLEEALAFATAKAAAQTDTGRSAMQLSQLLALDPDRDGTLTADELETVGRAAFAVYDVDGDGTLSTQEQAVLEKARSEQAREVAMERQAALCNLPKAANNEHVLFVSAYEAAALSDVTVSGQDAVTGTAELDIEAGDAQLYLIVSSYDSIIWRVTGHSERVARFVASSNRTGTGVTGLPKEKVSIIEQSRCLPYNSSESARSLQSLGPLGKIIGRPVDGVLMTYTLPKASLPSNTVAPADWKPTRGSTSLSSIPLSTGTLKDVDRETYRSFTRFNPGGLVPVDPADVVSRGVAERYRVLPQEAGLLQLLMEGALETPSAGVYLIRKPIAAFPAGLAGAHSVTFVLGKGVPRPAGNPGHSRVRLEGEVVSKMGDVPQVTLPMK